LTLARRTYSPIGLHGQFVHDLGRRIVSGEFAPGEVIAPEHLTGDGVSRTVVREGIRVLRAKGLVEAKPKVGTRVRAREAWNLLDPDVLAWQGEQEIGERTLRNLAEVRAIVEPAASRLAAERATPATLAPIADAYERMVAAATADDRERSVDADVDFHGAIFAACDNELLMQLSDVMVTVLRARDRLAMTHVGVTARSLEAHAAVLDAIRAGDPERAAEAMRELTETGARDVSKLNVGEGG
jgi:GntR family transcriptional regulator, galactonate operon transcriptional repressor